MLVQFPSTSIPAQFRTCEDTDNWTHATFQKQSVPCLHSTEILPYCWLQTTLFQTTPNIKSLSFIFQKIDSMMKMYAQKVDQRNHRKWKHLGNKGYYGLERGRITVHISCNKGRSCISTNSFWVSSKSSGISELPGIVLHGHFFPPCGNGDRVILITISHWMRIASGERVWFHIKEVSSEKRPSKGNSKRGT